MASSKGNGQFSRDVENKWERENLNRQNKWPAQPKPLTVAGICRPGLIQGQGPQPCEVGASGESALVFHPDDSLLSDTKCSA